jgi:hypothetical protein
LPENCCRKLETANRAKKEMIPSTTASTGDFNFFNFHPLDLALENIFRISRNNGVDVLNDYK